jgi:hypothetical protein
MNERITDPTAVDRRQIEDLLHAGKTLTLQFSKPCYSETMLKDIDTLCQEYGPRIQVRFYGFYGRDADAFDASVVEHLPNVSCLAVDCLLRANNVEALSRLRHLKKLSLGIYYLDDPNILGKLNLASLEKLTVGDNHKKNIDLSPLSQYQQLQELYISGHTKGIDVVRELPSLRTLTLGSIPKKQSLAFVSDIPMLRRLRIILAGRDNINEVRHPKLEKLEIIRVRGFNSCAFLPNFPALSQLQIEDQIKLEEIVFDESNVSLANVWIYNCKTLKRIDGLEKLIHLAHLRISRTAVDLDEILEMQMPDSLDVFALETLSSTKKDRDIRKTLDARGYRESVGARE